MCPNVYCHVLEYLSTGSFIRDLLPAPIISNLPQSAAGRCTATVAIACPSSRRRHMSRTVQSGAVKLSSVSASVALTVELMNSTATAPWFLVVHNN